MVFTKQEQQETRVNISAKNLNGQFETLLKEFEYKKDCDTKLKAALKTGLKETVHDQFVNCILTKKKIY